VLRNINAFTLGARSVDPKITTQLIVTGDWALPVKEAEAANSLIDQGVDVLTCHVDSPKVVVETAERRGIFVCGYHANQSALAPRGYLTGAEWNWITPYTTHVKDAMAGKPMVNFLRGGLKEEFVKTSVYGKPVPESARKNTDAIKAQMMRGGGYVIFKGPLKDNTGKSVIDTGVQHQQTDVTLEQMNYLVEGIIGKV
jgi:simple sugar transport system substrate-binding protein